MLGTVFMSKEYAHRSSLGEETLVGLDVPFDSICSILSDSDFVDNTASEQQCQVTPLLL